MFKYSQFLTEVKKSKLNFFKSKEISTKFTSSIEIELETADKKGVDDEYSEEYIKDIITKIKNSVEKELSRISDFKKSDLISSFIDDVLSEVKYEYDDYDYLMKLLNDRKYKNTNYNKLIIQLIKPQVLSYFFSENFEYLEGKFKKNLPNFYSKYKDVIKFELDNTLKRGIEFSNKSYFSDLNDLIEMINSFYNDFNNQKYWKFTSNTGIHINIGLKEETNYNIIKGLLFLNDSGDNPFVFSNMEWRKKSPFCQSLLSELTKDKKIINRCSELISNNDIKGIEDLLNPILYKILTDIGYKKFGVNLLPIKNFNYIEFRYPGGNILKDNLIDKVLYFTYIVYLMSQFDYDRNLYTKKLYKFIENEKSH